MLELLQLALPMVVSQGAFAMMIFTDRYFMSQIDPAHMADAVILVSGGTLRGTGDTRWLMIASVSLHWAMLVAQFLIIIVFEFSPKVSWVAFVVMILVIAIVYTLRIKRGHWRDADVLERVMRE